MTPKFISFVMKLPIFKALASKELLTIHYIRFLIDF